MNRNRKLGLVATLGKEEDSESKLTLGKEDNGESESKSSVGCDTRKGDE